MDKITIDRKALLALASETRIEILKKLDSSRMTLSELSGNLNMSKAAVKEHLDKLVEAGLVRRVDEGRKWIYYELTEKGRGLLHPESKTKIIFLLSSAIASIVGGLFELYRFFSAKTVFVVEEKAPAPIATPVPTPKIVEITPATMPTPLPTPTPTALPVPTPRLTPKAALPDMHLLAGLTLILVGVGLLLYLFVIKKRAT